MSTFTPQEKSRIFVERTIDLWPQNWEFYMELIKHECWSKDELYNYNFSQRIQIIKYAYENTKFYRRLYDEVGMKPEDIKTEKDWEKVPVVTKQMIADYSEEFEVKEVIGRYGFVANTGGSTGKPLRIFRDRRHFWQAPFWRFYGWHMGRKSGELGLEFPIWGLDSTNIDRERYHFQEEDLLKRSQQFWPIKFYNLSPYSEFLDEVDEFIVKLRESPLTKFYTYSGALEMFVDYCLSRKIKISNVAFIDACASPVTKILRKKVEKVFDCNVFDLYASNEMGPIAAECSRSGENHHLHVMSDLLHLELLSEKGVPVSGNVVGTTVITSFTNKVFPFIRYNHGDMTRFVERDCECGLPFPCIESVQGRTSDYLVTISGNRIAGVCFTGIFDYATAAVKQYQFRQSKDGLVTLLVVANGNYEFCQEEIHKVFNRLESDFQGKIHFTLKYVDAIECYGGKMKFIVRE